MALPRLCAIGADGLGPAAITPGDACVVALPAAAAADGSRTLTFQLIQSGQSCGARAAGDAPALVSLIFYDAAGAYLGAADYPTLLAEDTGATPRWHAADGVSQAATYEGSTAGSSGWASRIGTYWAWSPAAAGTCDVTGETQDSQGVLQVSAGGGLSVAPGPQSPAAMTLGTGDGSVITYDTGGALQAAAYVGFGGLPGATSPAPDFLLTIAAPGHDYPPPGVLPPPYFGYAVLLAALVLVGLVLGLLFAAVRRGRLEGRRLAQQLGRPVSSTYSSA